MVVTSVLPQAYFVERLGGGLVDVEVMIPPGASPLTYEPSISQMRAMSRAAVYVKVGHPSFPFEAAWLDRLLAENRSARVVDSSSGCAVGPGDPHVWLAPGCARIMARHIADALSAVRADHAAEVRSNLQAVLEEIDALDAEIRASLAGYPGRRFFVFHPAWGYFAAEYGLEQVAIEQGAKEPSPDQLMRLIQRARADGVGVVFAQPQFDDRSARLVAQEIGGSVAVVDPLAKDWPGSLRAAARAFAEAVAP